jgi:hypothetical protein
MDVKPRKNTSKARPQRKKDRVGKIMVNTSGGKVGICERCGEPFDQIWRENYKAYTSFKQCPDCRLAGARNKQKVTITYMPHVNQMPIHASNARFKVLNAGSRFGKDRCFINEFIKKFVEMLSEDRGADMVPAVHGWIIAPTFTMARQVWRELLHFFPKQWIVNYWVADKMIATINDGIIEVRSADDPEGLVGVGLDIVLITEAARIKEFEVVWVNLENRLMSPGRGPNGAGGIGLIDSTPRGKNFFYDMYCWGQKDYPDYDPDWESWTFTSWDNPYLRGRDKKYVETIKKRYPERIYRQEIMAEFLDEGNSAFINVEKCAVDIDDEELIPGEVYTIGYDPAKSIDFAGVAVRNSKGRAVKILQWRGLAWLRQYDKIQALSRQYNNARIILDKTGLGDVIETQLVQRGLDVEGVVFTNLEKEKMVNNLAMLIEQEVISYPRHEVLLKEFKDYQYTITKSGVVRYAAYGARHDDLVTAMMLAYKDFVNPSMVMPWVGKVGGVSKKRAG